MRQQREPRQVLTRGRRDSRSVKKLVVLTLLVSVFAMSIVVLYIRTQQEQTAALDAQQVARDIAASHISRIYLQQEGGTTHAYFFYSDLPPSARVKGRDYVERQINGLVPTADISSWLRPYGVSLDGIPVYTIEAPSLRTRIELAKPTLQRTLFFLVLGFGTYKLASLVIGRRKRRTDEIVR